MIGRILYFELFAAVWISENTLSVCKSPGRIERCYAQVLVARRGSEGGNNTTALCQSVSK